MARPASVIGTMAQATANGVVTVRGNARLATSRAPSPKMYRNTQSRFGSKSPRPGRMMIRTPTNPKTTAAQRRQPTFSPRNSAAIMVTANGCACPRAATLDSGASASAITIPTEPMTSPIVRITSALSSASGAMSRPPARHTQMAKIRNVAAEETAIIWPALCVTLASFTNMSTSAKHAIAQIISRMARELFTHAPPSTCQ